MAWLGFEDSSIRQISLPRQRCSVWPPQVDKPQNRPLSDLNTVTYACDRKDADRERGGGRCKDLRTHVLVGTPAAPLSVCVFPATCVRDGTQITQGTIFTARCYASAVLAMALCLSVCLSVRPSQVGVLLKRLNVGSHKQHHTIAQVL